MMAVLLVACTSNTAEQNQDAKDNSEAPISQEEVKTEKSQAEMLIGTWEFEDPKIKVVQIITYKADNTYQMKMGPVDVSGTWAFEDDVLVTKSRPDAPGQKKTITKLDEDNLWTIWEPKGGEPRELKYTRKKD